MVASYGQSVFRIRRLARALITGGLRWKRENLGDSRRFDLDYAVYYRFVRMFLKELKVYARPTSGQFDFERPLP